MASGVRPSSTEDPEGHGAYEIPPPEELALGSADELEEEGLDDDDLDALADGLDVLEDGEAVAVRRTGFSSET
jgi:hypothetical protein